MIRDRPGIKGASAPSPFFPRFRDRSSVSWRRGGRKSARFRRGSSRLPRAASQPIRAQVTGGCQVNESCGSQGVGAVGCGPKPPPRTARRRVAPVPLIPHAPPPRHSRRLAVHCGFSGRHRGVASRGQCGMGQPVGRVPPARLRRPRIATPRGANFLAFALPGGLPPGLSEDPFGYAVWRSLIFLP